MDPGRKLPLFDRRETISEKNIEIALLCVFVCVGFCQSGKWSFFNSEVFTNAIENIDKNLVVIERSGHGCMVSATKNIIKDILEMEQAYDTATGFQDVECIVNAATETLNHGGGVADVLCRAAGYKFQDESDDYIHQRGQLKATECCTTSAGNLKYKCVIHAVGPRFYQYTDRRKCADHLEQTVVNCLIEAGRYKMRSIALPAPSSVIFGVPWEICSQQYCKVAKRYCNTFGKTTSLKEFHFMDKDPGMVKLIQDEFSKHMIIM